MPDLWLAFALYIANEETDYGRQEELFFLKCHLMSMQLYYLDLDISILPIMHNASKSSLIFLLVNWESHGFLQSGIS